MAKLIVSDLSLDEATDAVNAVFAEYARHLPQKALCPKTLRNRSRVLFGMPWARLASTENTLKVHKDVNDYLKKIVCDPKNPSGHHMEHVIIDATKKVIETIKQKKK